MFHPNSNNLHMILEKLNKTSEMNITLIVLF